MSGGEIYKAASEQSVLEADVLKAEKMVSRTDPSDFDKGENCDG